MATIDKSERGVLFNQKVREGKSELEAGWEIERDRAFLKCLKNDLQALRLENNKLKQVNTSLEQENKEIKAKRLVESLQSGNFIKSNTASTVHCSRILNWLEDNLSGANMTTLRKECMMTMDAVKSSITFLMKYKLIKMEKNNNGSEIYKREG